MSGYFNCKLLIKQWGFLKVDVSDYRRLSILEDAQYVNEMTIFNRINYLHSRPQNLSAWLRHTPRAALPVVSHAQKGRALESRMKLSIKNKLSMAYSEFVCQGNHSSSLMATLFDRLVLTQLQIFKCKMKSDDSGTHEGSWMIQITLFLNTVFRSNRSFNIPIPRAYPRHLTPLPSRGWGIWSPCIRGGEFES